MGKITTINEMKIAWTTEKKQHKPKLQIYHAGGFSKNETGQRLAKF